MNAVQEDRKADWVIQVALLINAGLTGMFAYNYLGGVFGRLTGDTNSDMVVSIFAAVATVIILDGAFQAWSIVGNRDGLSTEQMATAKVAKHASMAGSLAASAGQFVLEQTSIILPENAVFVIALVATVAVVLILIMHVYWNDRFKSESFSSSEKTHQAEQAAKLQDNRQSQEIEAHDLALEHETSKHEVALEQVKSENELALTKLEAEQGLKRDLIMLEIDHEKQVAAQTKELLTQNVSRDAAAIAQVKSQRLLQRFLAGQNVSPDEISPPAPFDSPRIPVQKMAADGIRQGSVIHRVVKDASGNVISEEELPDLYAPVNGNSAAPN